MNHSKTSGARWLLLLPRPPSDVSLHTLRVAYGPGLSQALQDASKKTKDRAQRTVMDVGLAHGAADLPNYFELQTLFGTMYALICMLCAENAIDIEYDNGVDTRVFLFFQEKANSIDPAVKIPGQSPGIITLKRLAWASFHWERICTFESEDGETLVQDFIRYRTSPPAKPSTDIEISRVPGGLVLNVRKAVTDERPTTTSASNSHLSVAVGGTFDHLHAGHKLLLTMTALILRAMTAAEPPPDMLLTIGITGDDLLKKKKYQDQLEDWHRRQGSVQAFLEDFMQLLPPSHVLSSSENKTDAVSKARSIVGHFNTGLKVKYAEIFDPFGPTITDPTITALAISAETRAGGDAVNQKRREKGWSSLEVFEVEVLSGTEEDSMADNGSAKSEDFQHKLSSTDIRFRLFRKLNNESRSG